MKIAMLTNNYKPFIGGVPISVERLTESLRRQGHEVVVFAPFYKGLEAEEDVVRYHAVSPGFYGGFAIPDGLDPVIERTFREGNFDVIHVQHPIAIGWTAQYLSRKYRVPLVFTYHTRYEQYLHYVGLSCMKKAVPPFIRLFANHCDAVFAPTPGMKEYLEEIHVTAPVSVLPTGLAPDSFEPDPEETMRLRRELLGEKKYLFCSVARLAKEKNIGFLLESLSLRKRQGHQDFRIVLVGEGPQEEQLRKQAFDLDLEEEVIFAGKVPNTEVKNYCAAADLFLFASTTETQGIVSLEALAAGTPVLAVDATGTRDIVENGVNGFMTEESSFAFAKRLEQMLTDGSLKRLEEGAVRTAAAYREEEIAARAVACYQDAIQVKQEVRQGLLYLS